MSKNPIADRLKKIVGKDNIFSLSDEMNPYRVTSYFDTGCYILNAILSDMDIYKGLPVGKRIGIAGPSGVGKSYFTLSILKRYLEQNPTAIAIVYESEYASLMEMAENVDIDMDRVFTISVSTLEEFKTQCVSVLNDIELQQAEYEVKLKKVKESNAKKLKENKAKTKNKNVESDVTEDVVLDEEPPEVKYVFLLDSLGMLPTLRELNNAADGSHKEDMGHRAKVIKSIFRIITLKLGLTKTPMLICNHSYQTLETYSKAQASGGTGYQYSIDVGLLLSKAQDVDKGEKDDNGKEVKERLGSIITITLDKHRLVPEGQKFKVAVSFKKGIHPYSNMVTFAEEFGIITKDGNSYVFRDGTKVKMKLVRRNMEDYFTKEIMDELRDKIKTKCSFGSHDEEIDIDDEGDSDED